ncbi:MAG: transcriptional regulator [Candidatus Margulisbacteria bacterium GWF2_35_9]|nr:MAG: transcriptional regulator [Candidatus Margulisbacteria bacterium GWF2_35_9]
MKLITAIIRPEKLPDVKEALLKADVGKMTVSNIIGAGQQQGYEETYRGVKHEIKLIKKVRVDIAVNDNFVEQAVDALIKAARVGKIGDGKIWITPIEECIRIRTGEKGSKAIG